MLWQVLTGADMSFPFSTECAAVLGVPVCCLRLFSSACVLAAFWLISDLWARFPYLLILMLAFCALVRLGRFYGIQVGPSGMLPCPAMPSTNQSAPWTKTEVPCSRRLCSNCSRQCCASPAGHSMDLVMHVGTMLGPPHMCTESGTTVETPGTTKDNV
jgi:hypothetical protein